MRLIWLWLTWFTPPWGRRARRRAVLKEVKRWQEAERRAAMGRIRELQRAGL